MQTTYFELLYESGNTFPRGLPQDLTTCSLTDFPNQFIVRFEDESENVKNVPFMMTVS